MKTALQIRNEGSQEEQDVFNYYVIARAAHLIAKGWKNPDGAGVIWSHPEITLDGESIAVGDDRAWEIQSRKEQGFAEALTDHIAESVDGLLDTIIGDARDVETEEQSS